MGVGRGLSAPCLETHPLDPAPGRAALSGGQGPEDTSSVCGSWGGAGLGATTPKPCCLLVSGHERRLEGQGCRSRPTSFSRLGSGRVASPRDWGMGRHLQGLPPTPAHPAPGPQNQGDQPGGLTEGFLQHHVHRPDVARLLTVLPLPGSLLQLPGALPLHSPWRPASVSSQGASYPTPWSRLPAWCPWRIFCPHAASGWGGRVPPHPAHHPAWS